MARPALWLPLPKLPKDTRTLTGREKKELSGGDDCGVGD